MTDLEHVSGVLEKAPEEPPPRRGRIQTPGDGTLPVHANGGVPKFLPGVPPGRRSDSFDDFMLGFNPGMEAALRQCRAVAASSDWCAFLAGEYGTGKTHLAIAALREWYAAHGNGYFWKVPAFLQWVRRQVYDEHYQLEDVIDPYCHGQALVVFDDLGTENPTDWASEQLYLVLDSRYDLRLPTVLTTNRNLDLIDGRLLSRFRGGLVVCEGRDIRARGVLQAAAAGAGD